MKLTERQEEALDVLLEFQNVLLYGGARSGKTALAVYFIIYCSLTYPGLKSIIARRYATDIRAAVWNDTLPKVLHLLTLVLGKEYKLNEQQMTVTFANGSEIICAGLDDKERVDKILGTEYAILYVNESQDVPYSTVTTLRTRRAQKIEGFKNRLICDLNPTSINHWTYKIWFQGINPQDSKPLRGKSYGKIQMNPTDNKENLADGYIEEELCDLTGEDRARFLLGEYSTNSDLQVFRPVAIHEDDTEFLDWAKGHWHELKVTSGLDLGVEDADAFIMLAYVDGMPDVWLIEEYKGRGNDVSALGNQIKRVIADCYKRYPFKSQSREEMDIWTDTGGLGKKTAIELSDTMELPVRAAYKRDKDVGLFFLQDDVNHGRLHILKSGEFFDECLKLVWTRNKETSAIEKVVDDNAYHGDIVDAIIYAYRFLMKNGNEAMLGRTVERIKESPPEDYLDMIGQVMKALAQEDAVW